MHTVCFVLYHLTFKICSDEICSQLSAIIYVRCVILHKGLTTAMAWQYCCSRPLFKLEALHTTALHYGAPDTETMRSLTSPNPNSNRIS